MKKYILSVAVVLAAFAGAGSISAKNPRTSNTAPQTETVVGADDNAGQPGQCRQGRRGPAERPDFFKGIELTTEQKTALEAILPPAPPAGQDCEAAQGQCRQERQCDRKEGRKEGKKEGRKEGRKERRGGNCAVGGPNCQETLAKVKEILTPEQYVQFLENVVTMRPGQGGPRGPQGGCPEGQQAPCPTQCPTQN